MAIKLRSTTAQRINAGLGGESVKWEPAPTEFTRRCVSMLIYGDTDTGRTTLALTAPGPIGFAHAAEKIEGIIQKAAREKKVHTVNFGGVFRGSPQEIADQANPIWTRLAARWYDGYRWARTLIMDSDTEAWELLRLARFGEVTPRGRTENLYGPVNAEWRSMFKQFRQQDACNVITIGETKDEYREVNKGGVRSSERTGRTVRAGQKEMAYMADVVIRCDRTGIGGDFTATIEKGWFNAHSEGMTVENEDCRFSYLMSLITETEESEWE
jgi:hypothetical protein